jgi:hypothetical protein
MYRLADPLMDGKYRLAVPPARQPRVITDEPSTTYIYIYYS